MQLLTAVNQILSMLGEAQVTTINAQHSTVYKILTAIEAEKRLLLEPGWWFNTGRVTMYPGTDGTMEAPANAIFITDVSNELLLNIQGAMLYNATDNTEFFTAPLSVFCTFNKTFEDLPICAATVVVCRAGVQVYSDDLGVDALVQRYKNDEVNAFMQMQKLHLRAMRYNSKLAGGYQNILRALGG